LCGGQVILSRYQVSQKRREAAVDLIKDIRSEQYKAIDEFYRIFGQLMTLYRDVNQSETYPNNAEEKKTLLDRATNLEGQVDSIVIRIACEFADAKSQWIEETLGHLRQSVQTWRECIAREERLPFTDSHQEDYAKFKETFVTTAAFMSSQIHGGIVPPQMRAREAAELVVNTFSNKYEVKEFNPIQDRSRWMKDYISQITN